jgi:hydroxymethylglutaryl-CoA lyase
VRGYVSCVLGCPYEGDVAHSAVERTTSRMLELGCYEVSLGDTIGVGSAGTTDALLSSLCRRIDAALLAAHFHDTYGQALANILVAMQHGIGVIDSSVSGLGGCPYAPAASGNVATEDVVYMLAGLGVSCGVDLDRLVDASLWISEHLNRRPASR